MLFSTIGLCAVIQLVFSLVASPPPAAADQFFRRSRPHRTIDDGCASFTAKTSCLTGTGECTWHPQSGCVSATVMVQTIDLVSLHGDKGDKNNGDDEVSLRVSRKLKTPATPRPTSPTNNPTTRSPTNKPKSEPSTSKPTSSTPTTRTPSAKPTAKPSSIPSSNLTSKPTTAKPTSTPSSIPSYTLTSKPTTAKPTSTPSSTPSSTPTSKPTSAKPTSTPTFTPSTDSPTSNPTSSPTTSGPMAAPTGSPSSALTRAPTRSPSRVPVSGPLTCPQQYCANDVVNTTFSTGECCVGLVATTLATFVYEGEVLIELKGPSDPINAADLVITAPHGGSKEPVFIPDRQTSGSFCPIEGCKTDKDSYTLEISQLLQSKFIANYCKVPYLVINHLHRKKLDANREVLEAAQNNTVAKEAWFNFHNFTNVAKLALRSRFGTVTHNAITGVKALLFDMHGYAGLDWVPVDGSPLIQWGYRLSADESLNPEVHCPIDNLTGTTGSLTHARWMPGHSYECLVRGSGSFASRVTALLNATGGLTANALCGHGTPSYEFESPWLLANDPTYCYQVNTTSPPKECYYYSGGYDVEVHERMNWQNISGDHFNAVQAELPRCIRFGGNVVRETFANVLSVAVMSFLRDLYGAYI